MFEYVFRVCLKGDFNVDPVGKSPGRKHVDRVYHVVLAVRFSEMSNVEHRFCIVGRRYRGFWYRVNFRN